MGRRPSEAWRPSYEAHRADLIQNRLRWCAGLAAAGLAVDLFARWATAELQEGQLRFLTFGIVFNLTIWAAVSSYRGLRRPSAFALVYAYVLAGGLTLYCSNLPGSVAFGSASLAVLALAFAVLIPWGVGAQTVASASAAAGYALLLWYATGELHPVLVLLFGYVIGVSIVGAWLIERHRASSFMISWQQERLAQLDRDLANETDPHEVAQTALRHAVELIATDYGTVSLVDPVRLVYRVERSLGPLVEELTDMVGLEVPNDAAFLAQIHARGLLVVPDDDPLGLLGRVVNRHGPQRVLYATLQHGSQSSGILSWLRRNGGFTENEREFAREIARHAAVALHTARLVTDLREANRLKTEFVSTVSHELRTPLNIILGYAEMARLDGEDPGARAQHIQRIESAGRDLLALIESTLEVGRLEAERSPVKPQPTDLQKLWDELGEVCVHFPRRPNVGFEWSGDAPRRTIVTDPNKLTVVIRNLVGNAVKFTEKGSVRATIALEGNELVVVVRDTGIGIPADQHAAVFELFRQGDGSETRRYSGSGLGLYIVKRFVDQLGGRIDVESTIGEGSTFVVRLPVRRAGETALDAA